jgi:hypothetical protein
VYKTQKEINKESKRMGRSYWLNAFRFRYLLTPFASAHMQYEVGQTTFNYHDYYVFGFRIVRLHMD